MGLFRKQELFGEFTSFEGQVYNNFKHSVHIINIDKLPVIKEYIYIVDWGFSNPMGCVVLGYDNDGRVYCVEEFYQKGVQIKVLIDWLKARKKKYNYVRGYGDPSEPQNIQEFTRAGLNMTAADNSVLPGIDKVYNYIAIAKDGKPRFYIIN